MTISRLFSLTLTSVCAVLILLGLLTWIPAYVQLPLARDQGIFAWVGQVIADGGLPYADAWEVKGPVAHYLYAWPFLLGVDVERAMRALDLLLLLAIAGVCGAVVRRRCGNLAALLSAGLLLLSYAQFGYWSTAQPDGWVAWLLLLMCLLLAVDERWPRSVALLCGVCLALSFLIKPLYAVLGVVPLLAYLHGAERRGRQWQCLAWCVLSGALALLLLLLPFLLRGQLAVLIETLFIYNLTSHVDLGGLDWAELLWQMGTFLLEPWMLAQLIAAAVGLRTLSRQCPRLAVLLAAALLLTLLIVLLQKKLFDYHWLPFQAVLAVCAGIGLAAWLQPLCGLSVCRSAFWTTLRRDYRALAAMFMLLSIVWLPLPDEFDREHYSWWWQSQTQHDVDYAAFEGRSFGYQSARELALQLRQRAAPGDRVYLWGFDAIVLALAQLPSASRFGSNYPLLAPGPLQRGYRAELMQTLRARPPAWLVVQLQDSTRLTGSSSSQQLSGFTELAEFIAGGYRPVFSNRHFTLYQLRER